jgi:3-hydroxy-9,10-secoandrosta-1,3,5(10)-triene-9,17-dione monooxygenase
MIARASEIAPAIRGRARETERLRHIHPDTIADFRRTRLMRIVQPARVGGLELDLGLFVDIGEIFGAACASTAWVWVNYAIHDWMLALFPAAGQDAVWDEDPDTIIGSALIYPAGKAEPVDGGWRLNGKWPFSSGIHASDWALLGAMTNGADGPPRPLMMMVRRGDIEEFDTWHVAGLAGTGSHDVAVTDAFVPSELAFNPREARGDVTPGSAVNPGPLFRQGILALFPHVIAAPILGMAKGAFDDYVGTMRTKTATYNKSRIAEHAAVHLRVAQAGANIDSARRALHDCFAESHRLAEAGEVPSDSTKARWRRDAAHSARLCIDAVEVLYTAAGGGANYLHNPLQRHHRDIHAAAGHIGVSWDINGAEFGRTALGLPLGNPNV